MAATASWPEQTIAGPCLVLVEGRDESQFFEALIRHEGITGVQVIDYRGKTKLRRNLRALAATDDFIGAVRSLGIVRDADDDPQAAVDSVRGALSAAGLPSPGLPLQVLRGTAETAAGLPAPEITVAYLVLPGPGECGMLEDLCLRAVQGDPAWECVEELFACLERKSVHRPQPLCKARVHAYLATRRKPDLRLGEAAQAAQLPLHHPAFDHLKAFLHQLAEDV